MTITEYVTNIPKEILTDECMQMIEDNQSQIETFIVRLLERNPYAEEDGAALSSLIPRMQAKFDLKEIPEQYTLGTGHVKHFYNKMLYLQKRFESLVKEMHNRGYNPKYTDSNIFAICDKQYYNDYIPTPEAIAINRQRILERS